MYAGSSGSVRRCATARITAVGGRAIDRVAADDRRRRLLAAADARRADHAHARAARSARARACSASEPAIRHDSVSQTRTVNGGGGVSPSFTTSK